MKNHWLISAALLFVIAMGMPVSSLAATSFARSITYLDAQDQIVGQQILYCNNVREHAGTLDPANPNRVEEQYGCGDPNVTCMADPRGGYSCNTTGHDNSYQMVYYHDALGYSSTQYCNSGASNPLPGDAFDGRPPCGAPAPIRATANSTQGQFVSGWGTP